MLSKSGVRFHAEDSGRWRPRHRWGSGDGVRPGHGGRAIAGFHAVHSPAGIRSGYGGHAGARLRRGASRGPRAVKPGERVSARGVLQAAPPRNFRQWLAPGGQQFQRDESVEIRFKFGRLSYRGFGSREPAAGGGTGSVSREGDPDWPGRRRSLEALAQALEGGRFEGFGAVPAWHSRGRPVLCLAVAPGTPGRLWCSSCSPARSWRFAPIRPA